MNKPTEQSASDGAMIAESWHERRKRERAAIAEQMGPPAFVLNDQCFWRAEWGVIMIPLTGEKYNPHDARLFADEFIDALKKCQELTPTLDVTAGGCP